MEKKKTFKYGSIKIMGLDIPLTKNGLPNKTYLPKEVRKKVDEIQVRKNEEKNDEWKKQIDIMLDNK